MASSGTNRADFINENSLLEQSQSLGAEIGSEGSPKRARMTMHTNTPISSNSSASWSSTLNIAKNLTPSSGSPEGKRVLKSILKKTQIVEPPTPPELKEEKLPEQAFQIAHQALEQALGFLSDVSFLPQILKALESFFQALNNDSQTWSSYAGAYKTLHQRLGMQAVLQPIPELINLFDSHLHSIIQSQPTQYLKIIQSCLNALSHVKIFNLEKVPKISIKLGSVELQHLMTPKSKPGHSDDIALELAAGKVKNAFALLNKNSAFNFLPVRKERKHYCQLFDSLLEAASIYQTQGQHEKYLETLQLLAEQMEQLGEKLLQFTSLFEEEDVDARPTINSLCEFAAYVFEQSIILFKIGEQQISPRSYLNPLEALYQARLADDDDQKPYTQAMHDYVEKYQLKMLYRRWNDTQTMNKLNAYMDTYESHLLSEQSNSVKPK